MKGRTLGIHILHWTWELPQSLLGALLLPFAKDKGTPIGTSHFRHWRLQGGISLGPFIYIEAYENKETERTVVLHEYGHSLESHILGPLYLLVIGLPSFLWAALHTVFPYFRRKNYYAFYTEAWANHLVAKEKERKNL